MNFNPNLFSGVESPDPVDPIFKTEDEHNLYYIGQVLKSGQTKYPQFYNEYHRLMKLGNKPGAMAMIAAMGGIPKWVPPKRPPQTAQPLAPSRILDIGFNPQAPQGYRYNVGPGLPDRGSITNRRRGRRFY